MLKAISDRIIVRLAENHKSSLINMDETYSNVGTVVSVGDRVDMVKVGDLVVFHTFDELPLPEKNLAVIKQSSLLGVYTENN